MRHVLKLQSGWFQSVVDGHKPFEVRRDDRGYQVGDWLELHEFEDSYTGAFVTCRVTSVLRHADFPDGIQPGFVVLGLGNAS